jgi:hypothetical protein
MDNITFPRRSKSKTELIEAARTLLAAVGEHEDLDLVKRVYLTWTHVGVVCVDGSSGPIVRYREFDDPVPGYKPGSLADVFEKLL